MTDILITNASMIRPGSDPEVLPDGALLVRGERIHWVGPAQEGSRLFPEAEVLDAKGRVLMPGLVNAHMHFYSTFACGIAAEPAPDFPGILNNLWWRLDRSLSLEDAELSARIPLIRAIQNGTTTIIDHHASPNAIDGVLDLLAEAAGEAGVRAALCYEVTDRDGPERAAQGIRENQRFLARCRADQSGMLAGHMGLHASMTLGRGTLEQAVGTARDLDAGLHVHCAEDLSDQRDSLDRYGVRVIRRLADAGGLGPRTIAVHCVHTDQEEQALLKDSGTFVVHNPQSNMNNAVGAMDLLGMLGKGIRVGLGTDGMTSNMREEARFGVVLHRHQTRDPRVAFLEPVDMLLRTNPAYASELFGRTLGKLEPGADADLILVDHFPFTPLHKDNWYGHFLFGVAPGRVTHTMVAGKWLMKDGQLTTLDLEQTAARARELARETWSRFQQGGLR